MLKRRWSLWPKPGNAPYGPNCQGIVSTLDSFLYAHMPPNSSTRSFGGRVPERKPGHLLIEAAGSGHRFSRIISSGNEADLQTPDFLEGPGDDPKTEVILSYLEGVKDAKGIFSGLPGKISAPKSLS